MQGKGEANRRRRAGCAAAMALALVTTGCSSSSGSGTAPVTTTRGSGSSPTSSVTIASGSTGAASSSTAAPGSTTSSLPTFEETSDGPRSAPAVGSGTALLRAVRVGRNTGFVRIVFEFSGSSTPGYRIQWVTGQVTADGSGLPVTVKGAAHLQISLQPATGVDPIDAKPTYTGPDRIPVTGAGTVLTDLLRTGDFEAVLTWVAGAAARVPFRVITLARPIRVVVDLQAKG